MQTVWRHTKFRADVSDCDAWERLVRCHVSDLDNESMRSMILHMH